MSAERQLRRVQVNCFTAVLRQETAWFDTRDIPTLAASLSQDLSIVRDAIGIRFAQILLCLGTVVGGYLVGFARDWKTTLVVSAALPALGIAGYVFFRSVTNQNANDSFLNAAGTVEESIIGIKPVTAFSLQQRQLEVYDEKCRQSFLNKALLTSIGMGLFIMLNFLTFAFGFWYGGRRIAEDMAKYEGDCSHGKVNCFDGGDCLAVFFGVIIAAYSIGQAAPSLMALVQGAHAIDRLNLILHRTSAVDLARDVGLRINDEKFRGEIEFRDVHFYYASRANLKVLSNFTLKIPAGKSLALVGASGCGKSTLVQLLERFYDVQAGGLYVDGVDIREYNLRDLRNHIALVSQEPALFADTIAENIRVGRPDATVEEIEEAARQANAHDFIQSFPNKYNTYCGEAGTQLSGGQKQRIAIARAILRQPKIFLLDEATSALDNESERLVQSTFNEIFKHSQATCVIVAHRLSTIKQCDSIVVLERQRAIHVPYRRQSRSKTNEPTTGRHELSAQSSILRHRSDVTPRTSRRQSSHTSNEREERLAEAVPCPTIVEQGTHEELLRIPDGVYRALIHAQDVQAAEVGQIAENFIGDLDDKTQTIAKLQSKMSQEIAKSETLLMEPQRLYSTSSLTADLRAKKVPVFQKVYRMMAQSRWLLLALGYLASVLNGMSFPSFAILLSKFVGTFFLPTPDEVRDKSEQWSLVTTGYAILAGLANGLQHGIFTFIGLELVAKLRRVLFHAILYQHMSFFDNPRNSSGYLLSMFADLIPKVRGWTADNIGLYIQISVSFATALAIAFLASYKLAAVEIGCCSIAIVSLLLQQLFTTSKRDVTTRDLTAAAKKRSISNLRGGRRDARSPDIVLQEALVNIRIVHAYCLDQEFSRSYRTIVDKRWARSYGNAYLAGFAWGLAQFAQFAAQAPALYYAAKLHKRGELNQENILQALFSLIMAAIGCAQSVLFLTDNKRAYAAGEEVYKVIDTQTDVATRRVSHDERRIRDVHDKITFEHVTFRYPQRMNVPVFNDMSFDIKRGELVALVGPSGCGKSTVVQLLERFYELKTDDSSTSISWDSPNRTDVVDSGVIKVDGAPIKDLPVMDWRAMIGLVSQEPILLNTSIYENIALGRYDQRDNRTTRGMIEFAARQANAESFILDFPDGYETNVGRLGRRLSGGQRQRVAIARAIVREPRVLILDEATSALDTESERLVQEALDHLLQTRRYTTIVIAHRLSTIRKADKILVLANRDGRGSQVVEHGYHDQLVQIPNGVYASLCRLTMQTEKK